MDSQKEVYRLMSFKKKASLDVSISTIVIVVLAMTLLGLGLAFIKNMFGNIEDLSASAFGKVSDQLQRELIDSNEKLIFSQAQISLGRGKSSLLAWGIKNDGTEKLDYWAEFTPVKCPAACPTTKELNSQWFTFKYNPDGNDTNLLYSLNPTEQSIKKVDLTVPKNAALGLYLIDFSVYEEKGINDTKYSSTDIFITVS